jgi:hypothetical protein
VIHGLLNGLFQGHAIRRRPDLLGAQTRGR